MKVETVQVVVTRKTPTLGLTAKSFLSADATETTSAVGVLRLLTVEESRKRELPRFR